jgi:uncharacterized peroxidase-related enzyme
MAYIATPAESPLYQASQAAAEQVPNFVKVFALRPEAYDAWRQLVTSATAGMDERRYELVTLAAARVLGSDYCSLAHGGVLRRKFYGEAELAAIVADHHHARLDAADVAIIDFAERVAADPTLVTLGDVEGLRLHGLSDADVFQIVLAVCMRRFFSGVLSAVGADPDEALYQALSPGLRDSLAAPATPAAAGQQASDMR